MSSTWKYRDPSSRSVLIIYTDRLSDAFFEVGAPVVSQMAREGAAIARSHVGASDKRFIISRPARSFRLDSTQIRSELSRKLSIPVALIANNSRFALKREISTSKGTPPRPLFNAWNQLRSKRGVRGVRGKNDATTKGLGG
jgi:hypothetical protein